MAEIIKKFENVIKTTGLQITEARPVDDRLYVLNETVIKESFTAPFTEAENNFKAVLYEGMVIKSIDTMVQYIWAESAWGILPSGYTYPLYDPDYSGKTFNFVIFDTVVKVQSSYTNTGIDGIQIDNKVLPYHVLKDKEGVNISFKSSNSGYTEIEYPDKIEINNDGILIVLSPLPDLAEQFKIIIS